MTNYLINYRRTRVPGYVSGVSPRPSVPQENLALWVAANDIVGSDDASVSSWTSRTDITPVQVTEAKQPTLKTNIINGYKVVRFASGDCLNFTNVAITACHMFAVLRPTTFATQQPIIGCTATTGLDWRIDITTGFQKVDRAGIITVGVSTTAVSIVNFNNINFYYDNPAILFRLQEADDGSDSTDTTFPQGIERIGESIGVFNFTGDMAEILVYTSALDSAGSRLVETYLASKYDL